MSGVSSVAASRLSIASTYDLQPLLQIIIGADAPWSHRLRHLIDCTHVAHAADEIVYQLPRCF
jgi:hypothetical protein